ncbi:MAG: PhzF family phenazine biosynthesis protein [Herminiimonas sp.]|nr:PhzF family phenazine biosynthesis protein [Herminiimonas sp.]
MKSYAFRILNVFAETTFGGNPLCVFEDATGLDDDTMQAIARQFNLSETTFLLPSDRATARVRIFTTGYEMPFAGHPTLGSAHVVRDLFHAGDALTLEFKAGVVSVSASGDRWTFIAPSRGAPRTATPSLGAADIAAMLGLTETDLLDEPQWVDTGTDQLLVPVKTVDAVRRATPDSTMLDAWPQSSLGRKTAYVFAFAERDKYGAPDAPQAVVARYFFTKEGGGVAEDPGTGSACANLGGWLMATSHPLPMRLTISQGDALERPCRLALEVTRDRRIMVGGRVLEVGRGTFFL